MGARAHGRRHEGRAVRKARREAREIGGAFLRLATGLTQAVAGMETFSITIQQGLRQWQETLSSLRSPYPTSEGVEAVRSRHSEGAGS